MPFSLSSTPYPSYFPLLHNLLPFLYSIPFFLSSTPHPFSFPLLHTLPPFLYSIPILIHKSQIGFHAGSRTSDHLFTLKTLIDTHVKVKSHGKIFACFVDVRKAFDCIWHQGLFYKLLKSKVGSNVYRLIKEMYNKSNCSIKLNKDLCTKPFSYVV